MRPAAGYTISVPRILALILFFGLGAFAQKQPAQEPPEEDESLTKTEYTFNPLQAEKEMRVGEFYWKKGSWKAAAGRFTEATKWNPGLAEAWLRLGDAELKQKNEKAARQAYAKFLELNPKDKRAADIRKRLGRNRASH